MGISVRLYALLCWVSRGRGKRLPFRSAMRDALQYARETITIPVAGVSWSIFCGLAFLVQAVTWACVATFYRVPWAARPIFLWTGLASLFGLGVAGLTFAGQRTALQMKHLDWLILVSVSILTAGVLFFASLI